MISIGFTCKNVIRITSFITDDWYDFSIYCAT